MSIAATPSGVSRKAFESACQAISSARMRLPGPSGSSAGDVDPVLEDQPARAAPSFAAAQLMTTEVVRSGYLPAKTIAIIPPIDVPWTCARSIPSASMQAGESSAQTSMS